MILAEMMDIMMVDWMVHMMVGDLVVTMVGELLNTTLVVPVEVDTPVPPEATAIGVDALTVVKAPVDGLEAPIAVPVRPTDE
jgi:hypothetical protein